SARDVTRLAEIAMRNPVVREDVRETAAIISGGRVLHTRNDLLYSFPNLLGVKTGRSEEHTSELQSRGHLVCRLLLEKKIITTIVRQTGIPASKIKPESRWIGDINRYG